MWDYGYRCHICPPTNSCLQFQFQHLSNVSLNHTFYNSISFTHARTIFSLHNFCLHHRRHHFSISISNYGIYLLCCECVQIYILLLIVLVVVVLFCFNHHYEDKMTCTLTKYIFRRIFRFGMYVWFFRSLLNWLNCSVGLDYIMAQRSIFSFFLCVRDLKTWTRFAGKK